MQFSAGSWEGIGYFKPPCSEVAREGDEAEERYSEGYHRV